MKRLHVHVGVNDLDQSIAFYSTLFGAAPGESYLSWAYARVWNPKGAFVARINLIASGVPVGLGEPVFDKLEGEIAKGLRPLSR